MVRHTERHRMNLFTPDLYRNFAIGFVAGALVIAASNGEALLAAIPALF